MKNTLKKTCSIILALALMLSLSTVALADDTPPDSTEITGEGSTEYINLEIYTVTVPTVDTLDFMLDPQGLLGIEPGATVDVANLKGGSIIPGPTVPKVINNSSVDLTVSIDLKGSGDANFMSKEDDDQTTIDAVNGDTENNIILYAVPSSVNIPLPATEYQLSTKGYIINSTTDAITLEFVLDAADYEVTESNGSYTAEAKPGTGSGTAFQLGGYVNTKADWSDYTGANPDKTVGVSAVFSFAKSSEEESADPGVEGVHGILSTVSVDYMTITIPEPPEDPEPPVPGFASGTVLGSAYTPTSATDGGTIEWSATDNADDDIVVPFNLGSEETLTKIERIAFSGTATEITSPTHYVLAEGSLTITKGFLASLTGVATRGIRITTSDGTYTFSISWTE